MHQALQIIHGIISLTGGCYLLAGQGAGAPVLLVIFGGYLLGGGAGLIAGTIANEILG